MRAFWRRNRTGLLLGGALVLVLTVMALLVGGNSVGALDPDGYAPEGAHALAVLLRDRGVQVDRTTDVPGTLARAEGATVFVPEPALLSDAELTELAGSRARLVLAQARPGQLELLGSAARVDGLDGTRRREPGCDVPYARNAGRALAGGWTYRSSDTGARSCYSRTLLDVPSAHLVLLGDPSALTNAHLAEEGDAALGIGLLGETGRVVWLMPAPDRRAIGVKPLGSPDDLLPGWVLGARRGLLLALVVLALWRARRLGRVVLEQLPVVVRAAETVEGHGRLYQAAGARGTAADALRRSARRTLGRLSHGGPTPDPDALTALVSARAGRPAPGVHDLLYGPAPADDAALVRLVAELDRLTRDTLSADAPIPERQQP